MTTQTRRAPLQKYNVSSKMLYRVGGEDLKMPGDPAAPTVTGAEGAAEEKPVEEGAAEEGAEGPVEEGAEGAVEKKAEGAVEEKAEGAVEEGTKVPAEEGTEGKSAENPGFLAGVRNLIVNSAQDAGKAVSGILAPKNEGTVQEASPPPPVEEEEPVEAEAPSSDNSDFQLANKLTDLLSKKEDKETNLLEEILKGVTELRNKMGASDAASPMADESSMFGSSTPETNSEEGAPTIQTPPPTQEDEFSSNLSAGTPGMEEEPSALGTEASEMPTETQGMTPGIQGMTPGTQGMTPGTQGMTPGTQGMTPGTQGTEEALSAGTPGMDLQTEANASEMPLGTQGMTPEGTEAQEMSAPAPASSQEKKGGKRTRRNRRHRRNRKSRKQL